MRYWTLDRESGSGVGAIPVKRIDPNAHNVESIENLGSYIGSYIDVYDEPLFGRGLDK